MNKNLRRGLLVALALVLLAGFGCAKKGSEETPYDGDAPMTAEEKAIADQLLGNVIYFSYDRYDLSAQSKAVLANNADLIKRAPALVLSIEGHCDERGTEEYNLALGERRARAAYEYLLNLGVPSGQMQMVSKGKMEPAVLGSGESVWAQNRRDMFKAFKPR